MNAYIIKRKKYRFIDVVTNDSLEISTYVLQLLLNANLEDLVILLNYHKYKDNTGSREEINLREC